MAYMINQYFLPQFMIKKWITMDSTYKVYNKLNDSFNDIVSKKMVIRLCSIR